MVLFKCGDIDGMSFMFDVFTFHYGSIQIIFFYLTFLSFSVFTFHYGSIQILLQQFLILFACIYIPLWFYSNVMAFMMYKHYIVIYIPLWFYSNGLALAGVIISNAFTFHYGSIQILNRGKILSFQINLHSTMVLFKF